MLYSAQGISTLPCSTHDCRYIACQWTALPCQSRLQGSAANEAQPFPIQNKVPLHIRLDAPANTLPQQNVQVFNCLVPASRTYQKGLLVAVLLVSVLDWDASAFGKGVLPRGTGTGVLEAML